MNRRGLFPALAASLLLGVTAVVAQDLTDFDPKAIEARADLVIIPRFGADEIIGGGHADAFGTVAAFGLPVLTAVRRENVEAWLRFTGGIGTLLACRLRVVRAWWQETDDRRKKLLSRAAVENDNVVPLLPTF